ncbi:MAG: dihydrofolate reductase [Bacteroidales bacterium]|nr:dihydrofolate reductase [Bacteroidales bacterium]
MEKCLIVAIGDKNEIGVKGELPWHLSEDLKYFKETTKGFPVIMGRTTYFSLPKHPLPGRQNIVLNLGGDPIPEAQCVYSFDEAYKAAEGASKCFVIGGASVYRAALDQMDTLYITRVHAVIPEADVFFPEIDLSVWQRTSVSDTRHDQSTGYDFEFEIYRRK